MLLVDQECALHHSSTPMPADQTPVQRNLLMTVLMPLTSMKQILQAWLQLGLLLHQTHLWPSEYFKVHVVEQLIHHRIHHSVYRHVVGSTHSLEGLSQHIIPPLQTSNSSSQRYKLR